MSSAVADGPSPARTDLRLAGPAVGAWVAALAALHGSVPTALAGLALAAVLAAAIVRSGRLRSTVERMSRGRVTGWVVVGFLLGVVLGCAATAPRLAIRDAPALAALARQRATAVVELVVRDDPRPAATGPTWLVAAELLRVRRVPDPAWLVTRARVLVFATDAGWRGRLPGERLLVTGRLGPARGGDLRAAVLSVSAAPTRLGSVPWAQRAAGSLRSGLQRACAPLADAPGGLLPGLVVGDTSALDAEVAADFRATGLVHLCAVSGANVAIVLGAVLLLTRWSRAGPRVAAGACALALVGFVILARPSPSVVRAGAMGLLGLIALASGRSRVALPALCATVVALVVYDPELAGDAGFALSVLATGGLLLLAPRWRDALRRRGVPAGVAEALVVPAAAQVACTPVVAALAGSISLVAVPANLLAVPAVAPATVLGVGAALLSPLWPAGAQLLAWLGGWPAGWLVTVARVGAEVPAGAIPWPAGVVGGGAAAVLTVALLVAGRHAVVRRVCLVVAVASMVGAVPVRLLAPGWPPPGWVAVACAVGQGDATVLPAGRGSAVVVDAGPDPAAVDACLDRLRIAAVPVLVISHFHADHIGGLDGVVRGRSVGLVLVPAWPEPAAGRARVSELAAAYGVPVAVATAGWTGTIGDLHLTVVGPMRALTGTRSDPNNNSVVVRVRVRGVDVLLAGDAESEQQRELVARLGPAGLRAPVLKVAHHGSAYQAPEFLAAVDPEVAMVSVGAGNDYGHPNEALLGLLRRSGARVVRTDADGDVAAVRVGSGIAVTVRGRRSRLVSTVFFTPVRHGRPVHRGGPSTMTRREFARAGQVPRSGNLQLLVAEIGDQPEGAAERSDVAGEHVLCGDVAVLDLGDPGHADAHPGGDLLLGQSPPLA